MEVRFAIVCFVALVAPATWANSIASAALAQVGVTTGYDPAYRRLDYPGGDVPQSTGVCSDVVVRALREAAAVDLQKAVHEDMRAAFSAYPQNWGLKNPDRNIDHRRVPNLRTFFARRGWALPATTTAREYRPGDIVTWDLGRGIGHIGIVSDRKTPEGTPLIIHNIGQGTREEDVLFAWTITGHYRVPAP